MFSIVLDYIFFYLYYSILTFIIETIDSVNRRALMVPSQQEEILRIFNLVCQEKADALY